MPSFPDAPSQTSPSSVTDNVSTFSEVFTRKTETSSSNAPPFKTNCPASARVVVIGPLAVKSGMSSSELTVLPQPTHSPVTVRSPPTATSPSATRFVTLVSPGRTPPASDSRPRMQSARPAVSEAARTRPAP